AGLIRLDPAHPLIPPRRVVAVVDLVAHNLRWVAGPPLDERRRARHIQQRQHRNDRVAHRLDENDRRAADHVARRRVAIVSPVRRWLEREVIRAIRGGRYDLALAARQDHLRLFAAGRYGDLTRLPALVPYNRDDLLRVRLREDHPLPPVLRIPG